MLGKAVKRWLKMIEARDIMKTDVISSKREIRILEAGRRKRASGVTLIEVMVVTVILMITVLGTSGYRYYSSLNARWAEEQITAARLGQLLCGNWAGVEGDEAYDPEDHLASHLDTECLGPPNDLLSGFTLLGSYRITIEGVEYDVTLSWNDVSPVLRALHVSTTYVWAGVDTDNPLKKPFSIITYISR